jgi:site-specific recombinase XerD
MLEAGAGIADIAALLGHAKLSTSTKYCHVDLAHLRKQAAFHLHA